MTKIRASAGLALTNMSGSSQSPVLVFRIELYVIHIDRPPSLADIKEYLSLCLVYS